MCISVTDTKNNNESIPQSRKNCSTSKLLHHATLKSYTLQYRDKNHRLELNCYKVRTKQKYKIKKAFYNNSSIQHMNTVVTSNKYLKVNAKADYVLK